jgi:hypothetical protein
MTRSALMAVIPWSATTTSATRSAAPSAAMPSSSAPISESTCAMALSTCGASGPWACPASSVVLKYSVMKRGAVAAGRASHASTCRTRAALGTRPSYGR